MSRIKKVKEIEKEVLKTFKEEIPSIYFSDKTERKYQEYRNNANYLYRDLLHFPPKMFTGCSLIDFGAGTGENTISLANWGAKCTLIEMNDKAQNISKQVFEKYANNFEDHNFINSSIFDYKSSEKFDIVHCRGVLSHTDDKEGAFSKIASFLKPEGYIVFGDPIKAGSFQNMLQRMIIFKFASDWDEMVEVAEKLFKEDIDRSEKAIKRTRRAIIFDRFVVPKQDNPSISEVLKWFSVNNIRFYSSYPPITVPVLGDSCHDKPNFKLQEFLDIGALTEAIWMVHKDSDIQEVPEILKSFTELSEKQFSLTDYVNDFNLDTGISTSSLMGKIGDYLLALDKLDLSNYLIKRHYEFFDEVKVLLDLLEKNDLEKIYVCLKKQKHLFRGTVGLRHVDFVGYKM